jgi:hypothetical protein
MQREKFGLDTVERPETVATLLRHPALPGNPGLTAR